MNAAERCASGTDPQGTRRLIIQAQKGMNQVTTYCKKCSDEARKQGLKPREVLMRNSKCILCGETNICLDCHEKQGIPTIACINCLKECDRYIKGIDQVNENINSTLRLRESDRPSGACEPNSQRYRFKHSCNGHLCFWSGSQIGLSTPQL
jgi:hypothetical protein